MKPIESDYLLGLYEKALPSSFPWGKRLETAKKLGYDFVEISIDETDERLLRVQWPKQSRMEMCSAIANTGVPILTMCLSGNRRYPIGSENKETRQKGIQLIKDAVDFSVDIGNRIVQLAGYDNYYEERNRNTEELFLYGLYEVTEYAASNAVMLAIENVDTDFMNTIPKIMRYIDKVNSPWLCLYPDIGNLNAVGCTPEEIEDDITQNVSRIAAFHVKDVQPNIIRNIEYGAGIVDFEAFFRLLGRLNFRGPLVAEMWTDETEESVKKVITAKDFINSKMAMSQERVALKR